MRCWFEIKGRSGGRDLWVSVEWDDKPPLGPYELPDGRSVHDALGTGDLAAIGHRVWLRQSEPCRAQRRGDLLWTGGLAYTVVSRAFVEVLEQLGVGGWRTFDIDVFDRRMRPIEGYVGFVPDLTGTHELASRAWRFGKPSWRLIVSARVLDALKSAGAADFEIERLTEDLPPVSSR